MTDAEEDDDTTPCDLCSSPVPEDEVAQCPECLRDGLGPCCISVFDHDCGAE